MIDLSRYLTDRQVHAIAFCVLAPLAVLVGVLLERRRWLGAVAAAANWSPEDAAGHRRFRDSVMATFWVVRLGGWRRG